MAAWSRNFYEFPQELLPPWIVYPKIPNHSIGWRLVGREAFIISWSDWYSKLKAEQRRAYAKKHPAPAGWEDLYELQEREAAEK